MSRTTLGLIAAAVLVGAMFVYLFVAVGSASAVQGTATVSPPPREVSRPKVAVVEPPPTPKVVAKTRSARVPPKPTPPVPASSPSVSTYVVPPPTPRIEATPPPRDAYVAPENPNAEERVEMRDESDLAFRENRYEDSLDLALKALETSPQNAVLLRLAVASGCNLGRAEVVEQYSAQLPRAELLKISKGCKRAGYNIIPDDKATATLNPIR